VDDTPENLGLLKRHLASEEYDVRIAPGGALALESIAASPPDLVLLDVRMPDLDGFEVCRRLKDDERTADIPVIFLTALDAADDEETGLDLGAADYIAKPFSPALVRARVRNHLAFANQRKLLERLAQLDPLTETANRRRFEAALDDAWMSCRRQGSHLSVAMMDVDGFKPYNDSMGHPAGDRALRLIAAALSGSLRGDSDLVARYGGDEFVALLPAASPEHALIAARRMLRSVQALDLGLTVDGVVRRLSVSMGLVTIIPADDGAPAALIEHADANLYCSKRAGRSRLTWSGADGLGSRTELISADTPALEPTSPAP